jgi:hypothetical protein
MLLAKPIKPLFSMLQCEGGCGSPVKSYLMSPPFEINASVLLVANREAVSSD